MNATQRVNHRWRACNDGKCACGKPADCPIADAMCQDCWEKHCDKAWWKEVKAVEVEQRLREIKVWHECYGQEDKAETDEVEQRLREIEERVSRATLLRRLIDLTPAQRRVYQAIAELETELGYAPTLRQVAERAGLRSTSTVHAHLQRLLQAGLIRRGGWEYGEDLRDVPVRQARGRRPGDGLHPP